MSYTPTNWQNGDTITAEKLNKMEGGIESANAPNAPFVVTLTPTSLNYSGEMDKTVAEIYAAYEAGRKIVSKVVVSETEFMYTDVTMVYFDSDFTYPSFNAFIIDDGNDLLIEAATGLKNDGTSNLYTAKIYPLTPMS